MGIRARAGQPPPVYRALRHGRGTSNCARNVGLVGLAVYQQLRRQTERLLRAPVGENADEQLHARQCANLGRSEPSDSLGVLDRNDGERRCNRGPHSLSIGTDAGRLKLGDSFEIR